jgi:hypothetical protein
VDIFKILKDDLEHDEVEDCRATLGRFAAEVEKEEGLDLIPFDWNPNKNKKVDIKSLGINKHLRWPARLEEYAEKYIGLHGHHVPPAKRQQSGLQPFVTVEIVRMEKSVPVRHGSNAIQPFDIITSPLHFFQGRLCVRWTGYLATSSFHG